MLQALYLLRTDKKKKLLRMLQAYLAIEPNLERPLVEGGLLLELDLN